MLAVLLASALLFGLLPISVLAEETAAVPAVEDVVILDASPVETVSTIMPVAPAAAESALPIAELQATANATITVENVEVKTKLEVGSKKEVEVKLSISDNPGITVIEQTYVSGDVNDDGRINLQDKTFIARYIAKWTDYDETTMNLPAADVNENGRVNLQDKTIVARYIAKSNGYETLPKK